MAHDTTAEFNQEKNAQVNKPINLYILADYDGAGTDLRYAEYKTDVTFDSLVYTAFPIAMEAVTENVQGEVDAVRIRVANVSRLIQYYLENYDLRGKKITIKQVWANKLAQTTNLITYVYYIDKYTSSEKVVEFTCLSKFDVADVELPFGKFLRGVCRWGVFGGAECGYGGAETSCNRTMSRCRELGNVARFGAFPSIPTQRTFIS